MSQADPQRKAEPFLRIAGQSPAVGQHAQTTVLAYNNP